MIITLICAGESGSSIAEVFQDLAAALPGLAALLQGQAALQHRPSSCIAWSGSSIAGLAQALQNS